MKPLPLKEREYRLSLLRAEARSILPVKWLILVLSVGLWSAAVIIRNRSQALPTVIDLPQAGDNPPSFPMITVFALYALLNALETFVVYTGRVSLALARPMTLASYMVDIIYVTIWIYFGLPDLYWVGKLYNDFYILYFLLVLRGFVLFTSMFQMLMINALISVLFTLMIRLQETSYSFLGEPGFIIRLSLIWLVLLMAWFIIVVVNQQQIDLVRVYEQLTRADNLARIGGLAAGVAHEINNPLSIIIANTEYLKKITPPEDVRLEDIEAVHREALRCKQIVREMLDYGGIL